MDLEMDILFPGDKRVDVRVGNHLIETDQPVALGGKDTRPAPFDLFLASLGSCSGIFALGFCQARGLPTKGLALKQHVTMDDRSHLPVAIRLDLTLPEGFPPKYEAVITRAVEHCTVKKSVGAFPSVQVVATRADASEEDSHVQAC